MLAMRIGEIDFIPGTDGVGHMNPTEAYAKAVFASGDSATRRLVRRVGAPPPVTVDLTEGIEGGSGKQRGDRVSGAFAGGPRMASRVQVSRRTPTPLP